MIENFGKNVARLRKQKNMTQSDLAKAIGVNKQTISNIEKGDGYPTFNNLEKISCVLEADAVQLFADEYVVYGRDMCRMSKKELLCFLVECIQNAR